MITDAFTWAHSSRSPDNVSFPAASTSCGCASGTSPAASTMALACSSESRPPR
ncbi:MAG: hypothetical protein ACRDZ7_09010 [Acidimicrobiia bacterium]